jgi:heterotetrameric sarcosine oxidase gamma subunit
MVEQTLDVHMAMSRAAHRIVALGSGTEIPPLLADEQSLELPRRVGAVVAARPAGYVLCLGPAEWLAVGCGHVLRSTPADALAVVEVSDGMCEIELQGRAVDELLMSACGLDLSVSSFATSSCARTRFAGVAVVLVRHSVDGFSCHVARSHLSYVLAVLRERAQGLPGPQRFRV